MLKAIAALLLLANLGFAAWSHNALARFGWPAPSEREPQRLEQQVQPETMRVEVLPAKPAEAAAAATQAPATAEPPTKP